jgi:hypothetical protein
MTAAGHAPADPPPPAAFRRQPLRTILAGLGAWAIATVRPLFALSGMAVGVIWQACRLRNWRRTLMTEFMRQCHAIGVGSLAFILLSGVLIGLPGLPMGHLHSYNRVDLQRSACVRVFMGAPTLLLLEDPTFGIYPSVMPALINAIRKVRNHGAAVWWMTLSDDVWSDASIPADRLFRVSARELIEVGNQR